MSQKCPEMSRKRRCLRNPQVRPVSGHAFRVDRRSGHVWYAKYRLPGGRQVQKRIGLAWCQRSERA